MNNLTHKIPTLPINAETFKATQVFFPSIVFISGLLFSAKQECEVHLEKISLLGILYNE